MSRSLEKHRKMEEECNLRGAGGMHSRFLSRYTRKPLLDNSVPLRILRDKSPFFLSILTELCRIPLTVNMNIRYFASLFTLGLCVHTQ